MIVRKTVRHHVNTGNYESMEFEASVERHYPDSLGETLPLGDIGEVMSSELDEILAPELQQAMEIAPRSSYIHTMYSEE